MASGHRIAVGSENRTLVVDFMKTTRTILTTVVVGVAFSLSAVKLHAAASISFNDGVDPVVVVTDQGVGDLDPTVGSILSSLHVGTWTITLGSGASKPVDGSATQPILDLALGSISSTAAGTLTILFSDNSFGPASGAVQAAVGGNTSGSVTFSAFADPANVLFAKTLTIIPPFTVSGSPFSHTASGVIGAAAPYSLTEQAVITLNGSGTTGFDYSLTIPEPSCVSLFVGGLGLLLACGSLRRRVG
jgi:hypothetical protein